MPQEEHRARKIIHAKKRRKAKFFLRFVTFILIVMPILLAIYIFNKVSNNDEQPIEQIENSQSSIPYSDSSVDDNISQDLKWNLILVNQDNLIPAHYEVKLTDLDNGESVDARIYPALQEMFDAARNEGKYPIVVAGYRTQKKQQSLMDAKIEEFKAQGYPSSKAKEAAKEWVAIAGTSEHQLGIAVDINADGVSSTGKEVYDWLYKNAHVYGFILRYPEDKTQITKTAYEPWHYRYVGVEVATEIHEQSICLEEYLDAQK